MRTTTPREGDQFDWGLLRSGNTELMLNTLYEQDDCPAQPDPARIEAHGEICLYFGCSDVEAAYRHLVSHGIDAERPIVAPWGAKMCHLHDPDGYALCFPWPEE